MTTPSVTKEEVAAIAKLARLQLSDAELTAAAADVTNILNHFAAIQAIDTTGVPTADDASGLTNATREDTSHAEVLASHEALLDAAPDAHDDHIKVKAIF